MDQKNIILKRLNSSYLFFVQNHAWVFSRPIRTRKFVCRNMEFTAGVRKLKATLSKNINGQKNIYIYKWQSHLSPLSCLWCVQLILVPPFAKTSSENTELLFTQSPGFIIPRDQCVSGHVVRVKKRGLEKNPQR